jgi:peptide/nickel transport system permease protein
MAARRAGVESMWVFLGKRLLLVLLTLLGLTVVVFVVSHVTPGDPARLAAGPDASQEQIALIRTEFGLDRPLPIQYAIYLKGVLQGNFGRSIRTRHDVSDDIKVFLPATLELVFFTMGLAAVLGILFGILAAAYRDTWLDHLLRLVSIGGVAVPMFWLALMLQLLVALKFNLLPSGGRLAIAMSPPTTITGFFLVDALLTGNWAAVGSALTHLVLPALVLSSPSLAAVTRMMRADMLDTISREYVVNARANGLPERLIVAKYVLKNALIPTVTLIGLRYGWMLGGTVLVETVFDWPGIGLYAVQSSVAADFMPVMAVTLVIGLNFALANLVVDLLYGVLDPRVRYA